MSARVIVIGGGLAGCEAAWQMAQRGHEVDLYEMRPRKSTGAHVSDKLAELVCSNSLGSKLPDRASGILQSEMQLLGSLLMRCATDAAVPAGGALAVDRDAFAAAVTAAMASHEHIRVIPRRGNASAASNADHRRYRSIDFAGARRRHRQTDWRRISVLL